MEICSFVGKGGAKKNQNRTSSSAGSVFDLTQLNNKVNNPNEPTNLHLLCFLNMRAQQWSCRGSLMPQWTYSELWEILKNGIHRRSAAVYLKEEP